MAPPLFHVGMRYSFTYHAQPEEIPGKGVTTPRFAQGAFDGSVGRIVPLKLGGWQVGSARVVSAEVADDGGSVEFTYEITDLEQGYQVAGTAMNRTSFAFRPPPGPEEQARDPLAPGQLRIRWRDDPGQEGHE